LFTQPIAERSYYKAHKELTQGRKGDKRNEATDPLAWLKAQLLPDAVPTAGDPDWATPPAPRTENERNEPSGPVSGSPLRR
jgi:hypothetical protein